ncbi:hypothetical protein PoB_000037800 [Plakobranchus ocellatus]|uniref:Uncharacterized protein n=1 Tax=Plakobranchus ocellatus TaxID=259542 RepID=A0AAV3XU71_9GAST|nr:hypothetical protein PoB_000037800 [Plakobranchus ocellatus]
MSKAFKPIIRPGHQRWGLNLRQKSSCISQTGSLSTVPPTSWLSKSLVRTIRKRQATFLGHVMRRAKLKHLVTTGKFKGKRSRGRQREKITDGLAT